MYRNCASRSGYWLALDGLAVALQAEPFWCSSLPAASADTA